LTEQKGVDILIAALHELLAQDFSVQFLCLGAGAIEFEKRLEELAESGMGKGRVCFLKGYDPLLANQIYAAGDFFLIPSRYEPCGLTDYIAQLLGNLPIVHRVGGLVKVLDRETGFSYQENTASGLAGAIADALDLYRRDSEALRAMQRAAVARIVARHTWEHALTDYLQLYSRAMAGDAFVATRTGW
jgi:starch synthase